MINQTLALLQAFTQRILRRPSVLGLALLAAVGCAHPLHAQEQPLFIPLPNNQMSDATPEQSSRLAAVQRSIGTSALEVARVNVDALQGTSTLLALPGETVSVEKSRILDRGTSDFTWVGDIATGGQAVLVVKNGEITGHVQAGTRTYSIVPLGGGAHAVVRVDQSKFPPDHPTVPRVAPRSDTPAPAPDDGVAADSTQVDVLIAYTTAAKTAYGGNMDTFAQLSVDTANTAYANSNANVTLRLVGTMEVSYEQANFDAALDDLTNATGVLAAVHTKRDQVGADMVSMFIEDPQYCGLAWVNSSATSAFSIVRYSCAVSNYSFPHELGHNFGSRHDPYVEPSNTPFAYGHGYTKPVTWAWRTIMAYANECQSRGVNCPRLGYFSNPDILYQGSPMGTVTTHDNARVHRERVATVAAFRAAVTPFKTTHDFDGNKKSDIVWRDASGNTALWLMNGAAVATPGSLGTVSGWNLVGQRDFDKDSKADLLWQDGSGNVAMWFMNGTALKSVASVATVPNWQIVGTGDVDANDGGDLLWRNAAGDTAIWLMNGASATGSTGLGNVPSSWSVVAHTDFNVDKRADILWRNSTGDLYIWFMNGTSVASTAFVGNVGGTWNIVATGDLNGDGRADLVWRDASGNTAVWLMDGASVVGNASFGAIAGGWNVVATGDYDGDGKADLLWRNQGSGDVVVWFMNGTAVTSTAPVANVGGTWQVQATNAN